MSSETINILLGVLGFIINIVSLAVGGIIYLGKMEDRLTVRAAAGREVLQKELEEIRRDYADGMVDFRREIGDGMTAMREKIRAVELYTRDTFVRRETFFEIMRRSEKVFEQQFININQQFDKIDTRLDKIMERLSEARSLQSS